MLSAATITDENAGRDDLAERVTLDERLSRLQPATRAGVFEVLERFRQNLRPSYAVIAARHGLSPGALRVTVSKIRRGVSGKAVERVTGNDRARIDDTVDTRRTLRLIADVRKLLLEDASAIRAEMKDCTRKERAALLKSLCAIAAELRRMEKFRAATQAALESFEKLAQTDAEVKRVISDGQAHSAHVDAAAEEARAMRSVERSIREVARLSGSKKLAEMLPAEEGAEARAMREIEAELARENGTGTPGSAHEPVAAGEPACSAE